MLLWIYYIVGGLTVVPGVFLWLKMMKLNETFTETLLRELKVLTSLRKKPQKRKSHTNR